MHEHHRAQRASAPPTAAPERPQPTWHRVAEPAVPREAVPDPAPRPGLESDVPAAGPGVGSRDAEVAAEPSAAARPSADAPVGAAPTDAADPSAPAGPPPSPAPVDVRAVARASLAAGRSPSLWWVCTGIVLTVVITWTVGAAGGALLLAVLLTVSAVARATLRRGPVALTVRSRALDTAVLLGLALGVGILSQAIPTR